MTVSSSPLPARAGWAQHWDPHPMCWLQSTLVGRPYGYGGLGMRTCPAGGIAVTLPGTSLLIGASPLDEHRITWSAHTHDPSLPEDDQPAPIEFGTFTWVTLAQGRIDRTRGTFHLPDETTLSVADSRGHGAETRYRIASIVDPSRYFPATERWADLAAVEQVAEQAHRLLLAPTAAQDLATGGGQGSTSAAAF